MDNARDDVARLVARGLPEVWDANAVAAINSVHASVTLKKLKKLILKFI